MYCFPKILVPVVPGILALTAAGSAAGGYLLASACRRLAAKPLFSAACNSVAEVGSIAFSATGVITMIASAILKQQFCDEGRPLMPAFEGSEPLMEGAFLGGMVLSFVGGVCIGFHVPPRERNRS